MLFAIIYYTVQLLFRLLCVTAFLLESIFFLMSFPLLSCFLGMLDSFSLLCQEVQKNTILYLNAFFSFFSDA